MWLPDPPRHIDKDSSEAKGSNKSFQWHTVPLTSPGNMPTTPTTILVILQIQTVTYNSILTHFKGRGRVMGSI